MRAVIVPFIALIGLIGLAAPTHATPGVPHHEFRVGPPAITTVRQRWCAGGLSSREARGKAGFSEFRCRPSGRERRATPPRTSRRGRSCPGPGSPSQFLVTLIVEFKPGALLVGEFHEVAERFQPTVPGTQFGPIERRALPIRGVVPFLHALNLGPGERCFT